MKRKRSNASRERAKQNDKGVNKFTNGHNYNNNNNNNNRDIVKFKDDDVFNSDTNKLRNLRENTEEEDDDWFPTWFGIGHVVMVTMVIRLCIVTNRKQWWILHPDEVFQSIEVAHSEVYGYGFRPYEYLRAPDQNLSTSEEQQLKLGMFSLRSFIYPRVFMILFHLTNYLNLHIKPFIVGRVFQTLVTSLLPWSVHTFLLSARLHRRSAMLAAILVSVDLHLTVFGCRTLINSFLSPFVFLTLALITKQTQNQNLSTLKQISTGFLLGLIVYMRLDTILFLFTVVCALNVGHVTWTLLPSIVKILSGAILATILGGFDDFRSYGQWFLSPWQWFRFNVMKKYSATIFGSSTTTHYLREILSHQTLLITTIIVLTALAVSIFLKKDGRITTFDKTLVSLCLLIVAYSTQEHKETRFLQNVLVLLLINGSIAVDILLSSLKPILQISYRRSIVYLLISFYTISLYYHHPTPDNKSTSQWSYWRRWNTNYVNECYDYVGRQNDVTGVFSDASVHTTGAYSLLHRDVPWFSLNHYEFHEFDFASRTQIKSTDYFTETKQIHVSIAGKVSNFITIENAQLLTKYLLSQPEYNYIIIDEGVNWFKKGFREVFRAGDKRVLKRTDDRTVNKELLKMAERVSFGHNSTVLEYEGSWLLSLGQPQKSVERIEAALAISTKSVRAFQILYVAHEIIGNVKEQKRAQQRCYALHGKRCATVQKRVVLHSTYELDLD